MSVSSETIMYIVSHKDFDAPQLPGYVPILAGAVKNHASIEVKDNTGDNISAKNPGFCELTAQYWVWKNRDDRDANMALCTTAGISTSTIGKRRLFRPNNSRATSNNTMWCSPNLGCSERP